MSLSLLPEVTVLGGDSALSYACARLCECDFKFASDCIDFLKIDPAIDEPVAVGADAAQVADQRAGGDAFGHLSGGHLRRAAGDAIKSARPARSLCLLATLVQEPRQLRAEDQGWPPTIDGRQPLFQPTPNSVLMNAEQTRDFLHRIIPVNLDQPWIRASRAQGSTRVDFRRRPLRWPDARFRPAIQFARLINRVTSRFAKHGPAADHRQLGQPLSRAGKTVAMSDVFCCFRTAEKKRFASFGIR